MSEPYTLYTMSLLGVETADPSLYDNIELDTEEHTSKLIDAIHNMYWNWECGGETIFEFKTMLTNKVRLKKDYYIELINAYETKINMLDGNVITETTKTDNTSISYDLPRSATAEEHPTSKDTDDDQTQVTSKGGDVISLKGRYMRLLRNVYEQFARELKPCFIDLWS